mgnify:FL=1
MAKKKKAEEHENLERWLVSYADFMTLLFATFVVLYALAQSDVNSFKGIEEALKKAFSQNIFENQTSIMSGTDSIFEGENGATNPLMLEYMSQKYEQSSYEEIKGEIDKLNDKNISAAIDERGLVIRLDNQALMFAPASAEIPKNAYPTLDKIAKLIKQKFSIHYIQVEGHTDSDNISSSKYPSNWELSSARACSIVRFLISRYGFNPKIFIATGLADTIPVKENNNSVNKTQNRRVEIVILKNKNKFLSKKNMQQILKEVKANENKKYNNPSEAVENLIGDDKALLNNVIDLSNTYESENKRLEQMDNPDYVYDGDKPNFLDKK